MSELALIDNAGQCLSACPNYLTGYFKIEETHIKTGLHKQSPQITCTLAVPFTKEKKIIYLNKTLDWKSIPMSLY